MIVRWAVQKRNSQGPVGRDLLSLLFLAFSTLACELAIMVLVPLAANARGASNFWVGVLSGTQLLILVLVLIPGTWFAAPWKRRTVLALGTGLQGAAALGHALIVNPHLMILPQILLGLGLAIFWPAYLSYFAAVVAGEAANSMQGRRAGVHGLAFITIPLGSTYLAQQVGYRGAFLVIGSLTVMSSIIPLFLMSPTSRPSGLRRCWPDLVNTCYQTIALLKRPAFLLVLGMGAIAMTLMFHIGGPFLTLFIRHLGFAEATVGAFISLRAVSDTAFRFMFGRVAKIIRPIYLLAAAVVSASLLYLLVPLVSTPLVLAGLLLLIGAVSSPYNPALVGIVSEQFSSEERDLGIAIWITINSVVGWVASPALGALGDVAGLGAIFLVGGCVTLGVTLGLAAIGWRLARSDSPSVGMRELWLGT
jgi:MFS family permease